MRVFITGGSGYLGRATIEALINQDIDVTALARTASSAAVVTGLGATPVQGGLTDLDVLRTAARAADGVLHLGVAYGPDVAEIDMAAAEALSDTGIYVHTGGVWVYGDTDGLVDESAPQRPPAITAWRAANEERVLERGGRLIMPGVVYGRSGGLIDQYLAAPGRETGLVPRIGAGTQRWALVHVEDVAQLYVLALQAAAGAVYAGVTESLPMADVSAAVAIAVGGKVEELPYPEAEARMGPIAEAFGLDQRISSARARAELGWAPTHVDAVDELSKP
jgi:nucleoside-diphosphate-sugar epimerase